MKSINTIFKILMLNVALLIFTTTNLRCEKFLSVKDPKNQVSQAMVFKDKTLALSALADVYTNLRNNGMFNGGTYYLSTLLGNYTDEFVSLTSSVQDFKSFYELGVLPTIKSVDAIWTNAYKQIYSVNNIIGGVNKNTSSLDVATVNKLLGESYFIRGFIHFYLTNLFGEVPYIETPDYLVNKDAVRMPVEDVYSHIIKDLEQAESLLDITYPSTTRTRVNKSAAQLMLARVYLYHKDWQKAKDYALKVIENPAYEIETNIDNTFLKDSKSAIWQFKPSVDGLNTEEGQFFIFTTLPPPRMALSDTLLNSFEIGDLRKSEWTKSVANDQMEYAHPYKYKQNNKTTQSLEYSIVLRVEEAYLIIAETANELNNAEQSLQYLNKIRTRSGLEPLETGTQDEIRKAILTERQHEFFTEFGHRFFDLKRMGLIDEVMTGIKPAWKPYMKNLPLPEKELLVNPQLKPQNNGY